jgi:copper transport protein
VRATVALLVAFAGALLVGLVHAPEASAHASLVRARPADGAVIAQAPSELRLTFNEPVSPLVLRLIGPDGEVIALGEAIVESTTVTVAAPREWQRGTHVLSWRVVSADGHPVGGTLMFSIGAPSATRSAGTHADPTVRAALWTAKVIVYSGLFIGVGGSFFRAWIGGGPTRPLDSWHLALIVVALPATGLSVGLQGLDALELPLSGLGQKRAWQTGFDTSYAVTAVVAVFALAGGLLAFMATSTRIARGLALLALVGVGLALSLSGHASNAAPQVINRPAVLLHSLCVTFWIGSLVPLFAMARNPQSGKAALARFSHVIVLPLLVLVATGLWLAFVQLGRLDALWSTPYGVVLCCKLAAVLALLALGAANRYRLVPRLLAQGGAVARPLRRSIACEVALAFTILGLVALWRFTPPPRTLVTAPLALHLHGAEAMADIQIERRPGASGHADIVVLGGAFGPLAAKEVTLVLANPFAGIEPIRRPALQIGENTWRVDDLRIPIEGQWTLRVDILISDFEKVTLVDSTKLPRMP